jgi:alcohol dehydrogenase class IV
MPANYEFHVPPLLYLGEGSYRRTAEAVQSLGLERVLVVTDQFLHGLEYTQEIIRDLRAAGVEVAVFDDIGREPTTVEVDGALALLRESGADGVLAVGGGSPMDTAKAAAAMATNPGRIVDYMGLNKFQQRRLPLIAVPTTAGTGSEATRSSIITDPKTTVKMLIIDWKLIPDAAVVDPLFTLSLPPKVTADSGVDALTHAIEAYISVRRNPTSDLLALDAIRKISIFLPRAHADGQDRAARNEMMLAAHHAGIAFCNSSVALVHAMSRPIGANFGIAHGASNAMLLSVVMEYTAPAMPDRFRTIAEAFGLDVAGKSDDAAGQQFVEAIADFCERLGIPSITGAGIPADKLMAVAPKMAQDAIASGSAAMNPRVPSEEEIVELYRRAL